MHSHSCVSQWFSIARGMKGITSALIQSHTKSKAKLDSRGYSRRLQKQNASFNQCPSRNGQSKLLKKAICLSPTQDKGELHKGRGELCTLSTPFSFFFSCKATHWLFRNCLYLPPPFKHSITFFEGYTEIVPWGSGRRNHAWLTWTELSEWRDSEAGRKEPVSVLHSLSLSEASWVEQLNQKTNFSREMCVHGSPIWML